MCKALVKRLRITKEQPDNYIVSSFRNYLAAALNSNANKILDARSRAKKGKSLKYQEGCRAQMAPRAYQIITTFIQYPQDPGRRDFRVDAETIHGIARYRKKLTMSSLTQLKISCISNSVINIVHIFKILSSEFCYYFIRVCIFKTCINPYQILPGISNFPRI